MKGPLSQVTKRLFPLNEFLEQSLMKEWYEKGTVGYIRNIED
jgi:hypothetical protein